MYGAYRFAFGPLTRSHSAALVAFLHVLLFILHLQSVMSKLYSGLVGRSSLAAEHHEGAPRI